MHQVHKALNHFGNGFRNEALQLLTKKKTEKKDLTGLKGHGGRDRVCIHWLIFIK